MVQITKLLQAGSFPGEDVSGKEALGDSLVREEVEESSTRPHEDPEVEHGSKDGHERDGQSKASQQREEVTVENTSGQA